MLYMVVEKFKDASAIYQRLREKGRMMPDGLEYLSSWISHDMTVCYQLMQAPDESYFQPWMDNWSDLMELKIVPVRTSAEVIELMSQRPDP